MIPHGQTHVIHCNSCRAVSCEIEQLEEDPFFFTISMFSGNTGPLFTGANWQLGVQIKNAAGV